MSSRASFSACSVPFAYRPGGNPAEPSELQAYSNTGTVSRAHILSGIRTNGDTIDSFSTSPDSSGRSGQKNFVITRAPEIYIPGAGQTIGADSGQSTAPQESILQGGYSTDG